MADVDDLLSDHRGRTVPSDPAEAPALLGAATKYLSAARAIITIDTAGAYVLAYDAARKSITAHLLDNGLAASSAQGAHTVVGEYGERLGDPAFDSSSRCVAIGTDPNTELENSRNPRSSPQLLLPRPCAPR